MTNKQSDWIFNLILRLAVLVFLGTLALGLISGVEPVTALTRSGVAFVAFTLFAHAAATIWNLLVPEQISVPNDTTETDAGHVTEAAAGTLPLTASDEGLS